MKCEQENHAGSGHPGTKRLLYPHEAQFAPDEEERRERSTRGKHNCMSHSIAVKCIYNDGDEGFLVGFKGVCSLGPVKVRLNPAIPLPYVLFSGPSARRETRVPLHGEPVVS